jgi:hypothetical protein
MTFLAFHPFDVPTQPRTVTFAHPFLPGFLPRGAGLLIGNQPAQVDVLQSRPDGSVKHALVAVQVPALAMGEWAPGDLTVGGALVGTPLALVTDAVVTIAVAGAAPITIPLQGSWQNDPWRNGPLVTEGRVYIPVPDLSPDFELVVDVACFRDGTPTRVDVGFSRSLVDIGTAAPALVPNLSYDVRIEGEGQIASYSLDGCSFIANVVGTTATVIGKVNGVPIINTGVSALRADGYSLEPDVELTAFDPPTNTFTLNHARYSGLFCFSQGNTHALGQVWRHTVNEQPVHPMFDTQLLRQCGLMIHRDDLGVTGIPVSAWPPIAPLADGGVTRYFPSTGDRDEIGPMPGPVASWLISQDPGAYLATLPMLRGFGAVPWHLRDRASGKWFSATDFPGQQIQQLSQGNGWTIDSAHAGCAAAVPWYLTGRRMWLDDLEAQAAATQSTQVDDHGNRSIVVSFPTSNASALPFTVGNGQTRAMAWSLRTLMLGAALIPDARYLSTALRTIVAGNIVALRDYMAFARPFQGDLALIPGQLSSGAVWAGIPMWQVDYYAMVLAWMHRLGMECADVLAETASFLSGPFRNLGYPVEGAWPYQLTLTGSTGTLASDWPTLATIRLADPNNQPPVDQITGGDPAYAALRYGSLGALIDAIADPNAITARAWMDANRSPTNAMKFCVDTAAVQSAGATEFKFAQVGFTR